MTKWIAGFGLAFALMSGTAMAQPVAYPPNEMGVNMGHWHLNSKDVEALNNRCWVHAVVGDLSAALKDCNEALRLRPNFVDALDSRGLVNLKSGANKNAITDFDAALKINPGLTSSLYGRGLARQRTGSAISRTPLPGGCSPAAAAPSG